MHQRWGDEAGLVGWLLDLDAFLEFEPIHVVPAAEFEWDIVCNGSIMPKRNDSQ